MASKKDFVAVAVIVTLFVVLVVASGVGAFIVTTPLTSVLYMGTGSIQISGVVILLLGIVVVAAAGFYYFKRRR